MPKITQDAVHIRRTRPEDLAFVAALERRPENRGLIGQWTDAEHLAAIARERTLEHWIIEREGGPAGYLIAYDERARYGGVYLKRILVADKERGTGSGALAAFLDDVFARPGAAFAWLCVFTGNGRAQAVYRRLGFRRYEPAAAEAAQLGLGGDTPDSTAFRMRIDAGDWRREPPAS